MARFVHDCNILQTSLSDLEKENTKEIEMDKSCACRKIETGRNSREYGQNRLRFG